MVGFIKKAGKFLLSPAVALLGGSKNKRTAMPLPQPNRDDAAAALERDDELRRRKGAAADMLTGRGGAEAALSARSLILGN